MKTNISAIILTYNEEIHIERCINSIKEHVSEIYVIDSFSDDGTIGIAKDLGALVFQNKFINHANQFNWALENCSIQSDWIWRIDADEYANNELIESLNKNVPKLSNEINGIYIKRGISFMGKILKYGTWAPRPTLKIFRNGYGYCENQWMDEHLVVKSGKTIQLEGIQMDENLNNLSWWTNKHNGYATKEMVETLMTKNRLNSSNSNVEAKLFGSQEQRKRWLKKIYINLPLFVRPFINFIYRYLFRLGFMDGKQGFIWHVLQGFWYRFLVDAKIFELRIKYKNNENLIEKFLKESYQNK